MANVNLADNELPLANVMLTSPGNVTDFQTETRCIIVWTETYLCCLCIYCNILLCIICQIVIHIFTLIRLISAKSGQLSAS